MSTIFKFTLILSIIFSFIMNLSIATDNEKPTAGEPKERKLEEINGNTLKTDLKSDYGLSKMTASQSLMRDNSISIGY
ncbi:MAG: hypothetical protein ABI840_08480 [bacterium]